MYQTQPSQAKEHKNVLAFWIAHAQLANTLSILHDEHYQETCQRLFWSAVVCVFSPLYVYPTFMYMYRPKEWPMELSVLVSRVMVKWSNAVKSEVPMPLFSATPRITCSPLYRRDGNRPQ